jgi:hypothetical protein
MCSSDDGFNLDIIEWMIKTSSGELDLKDFVFAGPKYHS